MLRNNPGDAINHAKEECVKGSIHLRKDTRYPWWYVSWYDELSGKRYKINKFRDRRMYQTHPEKERCQGYRQAKMLLTLMRNDSDNGKLNIQRYASYRNSGVVAFYKKWLSEYIEPRRKPATINGYRSSLENWIKPYFEEHGLQLAEVDYSTLMEFLNYMKDNGLSGKGARNVLGALRSMFSYANRVRGLKIPPFPKMEDYGITQRQHEWLTREARDAVMAQVPKIHRPIFQFLNLHFRRVGEACALHKKDYDLKHNAFHIRRSISAGVVVDSVKTNWSRGQEHYIPCASEFTPTVKRLLSEDPDSPFLFVNPRARKDGKRYTHASLKNIWYRASRKAGVQEVWVYRATKHSSCTQFIEDGGSLSDLQILTDHARRESLMSYVEFSLERKRALMDRQ